MDVNEGQLDLAEVSRTGGPGSPVRGAPTNIADTTKQVQLGTEPLLSELGNTGGEEHSQNNNQSRSPTTLAVSGTLPHCQLPGVTSGQRHLLHYASPDPDLQGLCVPGHSVPSHSTSTPCADTPCTQIPHVQSPHLEPVFQGPHIPGPNAPRDHPLIHLPAAVCQDPGPRCHASLCCVPTPVCTIEVPEFRMTAS